MTTAKLQSVVNPDNRLINNQHIAEKVYIEQVKKLNKNNDDRCAVIDTKNKLQNLGGREEFNYR